MIAWQNAGAFWVLTLLAVPIAIHLLRMHRAERLLFPSLRFVHASRTAAVRLRAPSDWLVLALRLAILALAVSALAGPVVLTSARLAGWNGRTARAVVVDVSESMRATGSDGVAPAQSAEQAAVAELSTASFARRFDVHGLGEGLARASAWLSTTPPARREVVVISDFQRGSFDPREILGLPTGLGVRLMSVGSVERKRAIQGMELLNAAGGPGRKQTIELTTETTAVAVEAETTRGGEGLRLLGSAEGLLRAVADAGTPAGSAQEPIAIRFAGGNAGAPIELTPIRSGWMLRTALRLSEDRVLLSSSSRVEAPESPTPGPWTILVRDRNAKPLVRAAASGSELLLDVAAPPDSLFAASTVRAALMARRAIDEHSEQEIARIVESTLAALGRPAPSLDSLPSQATADFWRTADSTDGRGLWAAALVLLGVEQWLRARPRLRAKREVGRAA
jgi:hypothetical protein